MDSTADSEEEQPKTGRDKLGDLCESTPAHLLLMFLLLVDVVAISKGTLALPLPTAPRHVGHRYKEREREREREREGGREGEREREGGRKGERGREREGERGKGRGMEGESGEGGGEL